jgi:uncharacterized membrane protein
LVSTTVNPESRMRELSLPIALHLSAALPAVALGAAVLLRRKGTPGHRLLGWVWVAAGIASLAPDRLLNQSLQAFPGPLGQAPLR